MVCAAAGVSLVGGAAVVEADVALRADATGAGDPQPARAKMVTATNAVLLNLSKMSP
jgi:hypothetical protein